MKPQAGRRITESFLSTPAEVVLDDQGNCLLLVQAPGHSDPTQLRLDAGITRTTQRSL